MKKFSKLLIVGLFLTSFTGLASANFTDVSPTNPYADAIAYLQKNNIVQGYPDGTFRSNNFINRAEFTKILINATSGNTATPTDFSLSGLPFQDLEAYQWYIPYLRFALAHSVIQGYPDHTFRPQNEINFAEAAKMVVGAFGYSTSSIGSGPWYQPYVSVLSVKNAIPTTITSFSQQLTRGEMAEIIYRLQSNITSKPSQTDVILSSSGGTSSGTTGGSVQISNGGSGVAATFKISTPQDVVTFPNGMKVYIWIPSGTGSHPIDVFGSGCSGLFSYSTPNAQHSNFNKEIQTWVGLGLQHGYTVFAPDSFEFRGYENVCSTNNTQVSGLDRANDFISVLKFAQTYKNVLPNSEILTAESHGAEGALIAAAPNNPTSQPDGLNINLIAVTYPGCGYAGLDNLFGNPQGGTWKLGSTPLYSLTGDSDTTTPYAECSQRQTTAETTWSISSTMLNFAKFPGATHAFMGTYDTQANIAARAMAIQEIGKLMDAAKAGKAKIP